MSGYDAQLRQGISKAHATIAGVIAVTRAVRQRAAVSGFQRAVWMSALDVQFARLNFAAPAGWLNGRRAPGCWPAQAVYRAHAVLACGHQAHINHDLGLAMDAACPAMATEPYGEADAPNPALRNLLRGMESCGSARPRATKGGSAVAGAAVPGGLVPMSRRDRWTDGDRGPDAACCRW